MNNRQSQITNDHTQRTRLTRTSQAPANRVTSHRDGGMLQSGLETNNQQHLRENQRNNRTPWTQEEMEELIWCFEYSRMYGSGDYNQVFELWRQRNMDSRPSMDAKKLSNQRRYIIQNQRLGETILESIKLSVQNCAGQPMFENRTSHIVSEQTENRSVQTQTEVIEVEEAHQQENNLVQELDDDQMDVSTDNMQQQLRVDILVKLHEVRQIKIDQRKFVRKPYDMKKASIFIKAVNDIGETLIQEITPDLTDINNLIYSVCMVITEKVNGPMREIRARREGEPPWKRRIISKIAACRKDLSRLVEIRSNNMPRTNKKARDILKKYKVGTSDEMNKVIETLKEQILAKTQKINRFSKRIQQYQDNRTYEINRKKFFRTLRGKVDTNVHETPNKTEIESFWKNIYENESKYNQNAEWLKLIPRVNATMEWMDISEEDVRKAIRVTQNWKSPGPDQIANYWLKKLTFTHKHLAEIYNKIINNNSNNNNNNNNNSSCNNQANQMELPKWLTIGSTILLPKTEDTKNPKNYRPITCLPTMFKNLTSIIASRMNKYLQEYKITPVEQKGCCKDSFGCKDQLLFSKVVSNDCRKRKSDLAIAWIDYQKAFDSVPHDWILKSLELCGISTKITTFCEKMMKNWKVNMVMNSGSAQIKTNAINVKRGIFQGDSLSPLLFCIALYPLSTILNKIPYGYRVPLSNTSFNHLLYMDDLKIMNDSEEHLKITLMKVKEFSDDIKMNFGIDKCATCIIKNGLPVHTANIDLSSDILIKNLEPGTTYKYLGIAENTEADNTGMKEKLKVEYFSRVRAILRTELNNKNKYEAVNTLAAPVLQYSFGIINWNQEEIKEIDRKTRKLLTIFKTHHPSADVNRLYVGRKRGGRGLRQVEAMHQSAIVNVANYLVRNAPRDPLIAVVKQYDEKEQRFSSIVKKANHIINALGIKNEMDNELDYQKRKKIVKLTLDFANEREWKIKPMHGQYIRNLEEQPLDKSKSIQWLTNGALKGETESLIVAAQDQALHTNYVGNKIYNTRNSSKCRLCQQYDETIDHIVSGCPVLARVEYIERHDKVATMLHHSICQKLGIQLETTKWYQHSPKPVMTTPDNTTTVIWNQPIITDRVIQNNKPDIVIRRLHNSEQERCLLIDVAIPADSNVIKKEAEKILKYRSLKIEVSRMWNTKTEVVPVIISATGNVSNNLKKYLDNIPGNHYLPALQKTAILGTARIIRKVIT